MASGEQLRVETEVRRIRAMLPRYYKYTQARYADALLEYGKIRIGTLSDFRKEEQHGAWIGDRNEGREFRQHMLQGRHVIKGGRLPDIPAQFIKNVPPDLNLTLEDVTFMRSVEVEDLYVFCVSKEFSESEMRVAGYDACVVIEHPEAFVIAIAQALGPAIRGGGFGECVYQDRVLPWEKEAPHPALVKEPRYFKQRECRAFFEPVELPITPKDLVDPAFRSMCRRLI